MSTKIVMVFSAHGSDEDGRNGRLLGYYTTEAAADMAAMGQGYGGEGNVSPVYCIESDGELFALVSTKPIKIDTKHDNVVKLKKSALDKLTKEEKAALGIKS